MASVGAEAPSGLDALGVMSYTDTNPDGSAGDPKHVAEAPWSVAE